MINVREQFPIFRHHPELVYCDTAATAQKPESVIRAVSDFYEKHNANIHRGLYDLSLKATEIVEDTRSQVAALIAARSPQEVVFVRNATEAINLVAHAWGRQQLSTGDEILITEMEHHANIVPWQQVAKQTGAVLKFVRVNEQFEIDEAHFDELLSEKTKLVGMVHASNVLGTINNVQALTAKAKARGAMVLIDAAQSVPHIEVDVKEIDCDFLVFSGHKLYGSTGVGVLWARKELLDSMPPFLTGGDMIEHVTKTDAVFAESPTKFEAGTPDIAGIAGLGAAVQFIQSLGFAGIIEHEQELGNYALQQFQGVPGMKIYGPPTMENRLATFAFTLDGAHPHDLASLLNDHHVAIRAGNHCAEPLGEALGVGSTARASFGVYSNHDDVDKLVAALKAVQKLFQ